MTNDRAILIGIDVGTTNLKFVAARPGGAVVAVVRRPMVVARPAPHAAEFDIGALRANIFGGLKELAEHLGPAIVTVAGIGVASIGESFVGIGADGEPVMTCPTWFDRRTENSRPLLGLSPAEWFDITGMVDDDIYTVHRIRWWAAKHPEVSSRVHRWAMVADFVVYMLSGALVASPSLAARSGLADRNFGSWSRTILDAAGIRESSLPELKPSATVSGHLSDAAAQLTGFVAGTPIVNAGHDHPCAGLGCGLAEPGPVIDSAGTSEALKTILARPLNYGETGGGQYDCYPHVVPGRYILSGHTPASGALLDWLVRLFLGASPGKDQVEALWTAAAAVPAGSNEVRVMPFLEGTGAPWNNRGRRASLDVLGAETHRAAILRAGVEALVAWLLVNLGRYDTLAGIRPAELIVTGGGSRNSLANQIKASMSGLPLLMPAVEETAGLGVALVAGLATGLFASGAEAAALPDISWQRLDPDPVLAKQYAPLTASMLERLEEGAAVHG